MKGRGAKLSKRIVSFVLTLAMVMTLMPGMSVTVYADTTPNYLTFTAEKANSTIKFNYAYAESIQYSLDGSSWNDYGNNVEIKLENIGDKVLFKGIGVIAGFFNRFVMSGKIAASGSVTSLAETPELPATNLEEYCYSQMFYDCTGLTRLPNLPTTALVKSCYADMFSGCTGIELQYKKIGNFTQGWKISVDSEDMVQNWTSNYYNYAGQMFRNCTNVHLVSEDGASVFDKQIPKLNYTYYMKSLHTHIFNYEVGMNTDSNKIIATCSADGCDIDDGTDEHAHKMTLTLTASSANYSGSPVTYGEDSLATGKDIGFTGVEGWTDASLSYDVKYYIAYTDEEHNTPTSSTNGGSSEEGTAPKNVGSYIVVLKAKEGEVVKKTLAKSFSINAKTITSDFITLEAASKEYTGAEITNAVTVKDGENILTVDTDYTVTGNKGTAKGSYTVTVTGTGNYKGTATKTWNITGAIPTIDTNPTIGSIIYGQKLSDSTLTGGVAKKGTTAVPGTFAWKTSDVTPKVSDSNSTNYTIVFTPTDTENYGTVEFDAKVTVNKKTLTAKILDQTALRTTGATYTVSPNMIILDGIEAADKGKVEVATITEGNNPSIASAGTYELTATGLTLSGVASANYQVTSITKGTLTVKEPDGGVKINDADSGRVFVEVNKETDLPTTIISNMDKELAAALHYPTEETNVTNGQDALIYLDLKDGEDLASAEEVSGIDTAVTAGENKGALLDLSLYKMIGGAAAEK